MCSAVQRIAVPCSKTEDRYTVRSSSSSTSIPYDACYDVHTVYTQTQKSPPVGLANSQTVKRWSRSQTFRPARPTSSRSPLVCLFFPSKPSYPTPLSFKSFHPQSQPHCILLAVRDVGILHSTACCRSCCLALARFLPPVSQNWRTPLAESIRFWCKSSTQKCNSLVVG